jgi:hypothetical protein
MQALLPDQSDHVFHVHNSVNDARSHCRGSAKRLEDAAEVIEHERERG